VLGDVLSVCDDGADSGECGDVYEGISVDDDDVGVVFRPQMALSGRESTCVGGAGRRGGESVGGGMPPATKSLMAIGSTPCGLNAPIPESAPETRRTPA
jgi:hypothetical protein